MTFYLYQNNNFDLQIIDLQSKKCYNYDYKKLGGFKMVNKDTNISGILIQHPLPSHLNEQKIFNYIDPKKDVDGLNTTSFGNMTMGITSYAPATPGAIMEILNYYNINMEGKKAVVVGRSNILGKPIAMLLLNANATVTMCHSKTNNLVYRYVESTDENQYRKIMVIHNIIGTDKHFGYRNFYGIGK